MGFNYRAYFQTRDNNIVQYHKRLIDSAAARGGCRWGRGVSLTREMQKLLFLGWLFLSLGPGEGAGILPSQLARAIPAAVVCGYCECVVLRFKK